MFVQFLLISKRKLSIQHIDVKQFQLLRIIIITSNYFNVFSILSIHSDHIQCDLSMSVGAAASRTMQL